MDNFLEKFFLSIFTLWPKVKYFVFVILLIFLFLGNKTLFSFSMLAIYWLVADFLSVFVLNIVGLPGAMVASKLKQQKIGLALCVIAHSYVYFAYMAYIINWTRLVVTIQGVSPLIWVLTFIASVWPMWMSLLRARREAAEDKYTNVQVESLGIVWVLMFIAFFVFAFLPTITRLLYGWLPYVK